MEEIQAEKTGRAVAFRRDPSSASEAAQVGEAFQYEILTPVRLARQQSAMLPLLRAEIPAEKVSIYNPSVHPKHPLLGVRITNTSPYYFIQGPVTIFDHGVYAGEAKAQDVPPGSQRLLSYGLDLQVEVATENQSMPAETIHVQLIRGVAHISQKFLRTCVYQVKNSSEKLRHVLIKHPYHADWTLLNPREPSEKTRDLYRFLLVVHPGQSVRLVVEEELQNVHVMAISSMNEDLIAMVMNSQSTSEQVKEAIRLARQRKDRVNSLEHKRFDLEKQIDQIRRDQARIRKNMPQVDKTSDLYQRYVQKLTIQEDQIEQLQAQLGTLGAEIEAAKKNLDDYLMSLDIG